MNAYTIITTVCPLCGRVTEISVRTEDYARYQAGALAQDAFPYLSADEREMLISGICPTCWDEVFAGYDEWNEGLEQTVFDDYQDMAFEALSPEDGDEVDEPLADGEDDDEDFDYEPDYDECGFNPYLGCYDFDC